MTRGEAVNWIINIAYDIGKAEHRELWHYEQALSEIRDMLQSEPERKAVRWIPCSERLPEDYEDVLVWFEYFRYGDYNRLYQTHGIGDYSSEYDSWMINHESGWSKLRVFAWMPLPKPYREERTEE